MCCGVSNKGPAIYEGKVFRSTFDAHVVALRCEDRQGALEDEGGRVEGRLLDDRRTADCERGADHRHIGRRVRHPRFHRRLGSGDRQAALAALHHSGPRREGKRNVAAGHQYLEDGGGSTWITGSYDPELDLVYWGTGNAGAVGSQSGQGDNLYTSSVLAIRPKTGEIVWHYQFTPNDTSTSTPAGR